MKQPIFTFANQLTLLRLLLIPFFALSILAGNYGWGLGLLVVAGLTDFFDGLLARRLEQRTPLGAMLDPIADKLLLSTSFIVLAVSGAVPWWLSILVLSRDFLILAVALAITIGAGFRPFPPSLYGKACTTVQILTVFVVLLVEVLPAAGLVGIKQFLLWLTAALTVASGVHYAYRTSKLVPGAPPS
ncbi:MAG TPA: CDP-diacylglycerol--glycerol-3-phosphate 3-phosphatidyltransferase [Candidatus Acidoferrales bacterium]|nr:CDP-diacylglycerol--glycerol-3-phosphate 3-phosphatidyltransferase [Candidatus Acidoferrales bacterium]